MNKTYEAYITCVDIMTKYSINIMKYIENNGILKIILLKPIVSAVRSSLQTHQNFEASTVYNARIYKSNIEAKRIQYEPSLIDNRVGYKAHNKTPVVHWQAVRQIKNKDQVLGYRPKAVWPSLRTHENSEAATNYSVRINKNCLLYTSPSPRDRQKSRMPSSA